MAPLTYGTLKTAWHWGEDPFLHHETGTGSAQAEG